MSDRYYPDLQMADMKVEPTWRTSRVDFENGYAQRNGIWNHPILSWQLDYPILYPAQFDTLLNFYLAHRGMAESFLFTDYTDESPRNRQFGVGTGIRREFKLVHDVTSAVVIRVDGSVVTDVYADPATGRVLFDVAPAAGTLLTYDATDAAYRVTFADDRLPYDRHKYIAYGGSVSLIQAVALDDLYPVRQEVWGGDVYDKRLNAVGKGTGFSFCCPRDITVGEIWFYAPAMLTPGTVRVAICTNVDGLPGTELTASTFVPGGAPSVQVVGAGPLDLVRGVRYWVTVRADSGTWDATHYCDVRYCDGIPYISWGDPQDAILWGGYNVQDLNLTNTRDSWLGTAERSTDGSWSVRDSRSHGAFFLNSSGDMVGHVQVKMTSNLYGVFQMRQVIPVTTLHSFYIDRIGGVFSTAAAPADDLHYYIELGSAPGVVQRLGHLASPVALGGAQLYFERHLTSPLLVPAGDTLYLFFHSPLSLIGAPWTHHGVDEKHVAFSGGWDADWDGILYAGAGASCQLSAASGAPGSWLTTFGAALTVKCRGWFVP